MHSVCGLLFFCLYTYMKFTYILIAGMLMSVAACSSKAQSEASADAVADTVTAVSFDADSAMAYVAAQTAFGPRVPGSEAHARCADWLEGRLKAAGCEVTRQHGTVTDMEGKTQPIDNIIARFNPQASNRILLLAHYDTRPWADADPDAANHDKPIDGANDGASGVAVILEVVRQLKAANAQVGVDVLFTDLEDSGMSAPDDADEATQKRYDATWCRGTQYFVANMPFEASNAPRAAILLDMVGGRDAVFAQEYFSMNAAPALMRAVWQAARQAGYGDRFVERIGGAVNDDHQPLIDAGIPAIDIIEIGHPATGSFNPTWHTLDDNLSNIDPGTLRAVGATLMTYLMLRE